MWGTTGVNGLFFKRRQEITKFVVHMLSESWLEL